MDNPISFSQVLDYILPFLSIATYLVAILLALNCVWRVENKMDRFLKLVTVAMIIVFTRLIMRAIGLADNPYWLWIAHIFDIASGILLIIAFGVLLKTLKKLSHEDKIG